MVSRMRAAEHSPGRVFHTRDKPGVLFSSFCMTHTKGFFFRRPEASKPTAKIPKSSGDNVFIVRCTKKKETRTSSTPVCKIRRRSRSMPGRAARGHECVDRRCSGEFLFVHLLFLAAAFTPHALGTTARVLRPSAYFHLNKPLMTRVCVVFWFPFICTRARICDCLTVISHCIWCFVDDVTHIQTLPRLVRL